MHSWNIDSRKASSKIIIMNANALECGTVLIELLKVITLQLTLPTDCLN